MQRKKSKRKWVRNILILLVIILVLLVFDNRFGLGSGLAGLITSSTDPTEPTTVESTVSEFNQRTIRVTEQIIYLDDVEISLDDLEGVLKSSDLQVIYTLKDDLANHALFVDIENILETLKLVYTIE